MSVAKISAHIANAVNEDTTISKAEMETILSRKDGLFKGPESVGSEVTADEYALLQKLKVDIDNGTYNVDQGARVMLDAFLDHSRTSTEIARSATEHGASIGTTVGVLGGGIIGTHGFPVFGTALGAVVGGVAGWCVGGLATDIVAQGWLLTKTSGLDDWSRMTMRELHDLEIDLPASWTDESVFVFRSAEPEDGAHTTLSVSRRPWQGDLDAAFREFHTGIVNMRLPDARFGKVNDLTIDGHPAKQVDVWSSSPPGSDAPKVRGRHIVTLHQKKLYTVSLTASDQRFDDKARLLETLRMP